MTAMFKASYLLGYMPNKWRKATVIFIPKPGKKDYSLVRSFRPITLSNFIVKAMERIILWHLTETTLKDNPLNENQHAFRKGKSTETALSNMAENIESALVKGEYALGVFLDIQGAFDNITTDSIVRGMRRKGTSEHLVKWYPTEHSSAVEKNSR